VTNDTLTMTDNVRDRSARVRLAERAAPAPQPGEAYTDIQDTGAGQWR